MKNKIKWFIGIIVAITLMIGVYVGTEDWRESYKQTRFVEQQLESRLEVVRLITGDEVELKSVKRKEHPTMEIYDVRYKSDKLNENIQVDEPMVLLQEQGEMSMVEYDYLTRLMKEKHLEGASEAIKFNVITSLSFAEAYDLFIESKYDRYDFKATPMRIVVSVNTLTDKIEKETIDFIKSEKIDETDLEVVLLDESGNEKHYDKNKNKFINV